eukprot:TRINITY_DN16047_c0_g3_i1.p1 TRINITY_DN16047_c0_g3~~TRINITY_DN16047_c0_g3_i1.p1  ORF type:complete len:640 (+),score=123.06 TRINITY_DN16047_c0_g3_i1:51-1922(+)
MLRLSPRLLKNVMIVESPSKAKSIQGYLDDSWLVMASRGHVVELMNIDPVNMTGMWQFTEGKEALLQKVIEFSRKGKDNIFLATDPDREGELIANDINDYLLKHKIDTAQRVFFNEVTKAAVHEAMESPGPLNANLIEAGNARRIIDWYFGIGASKKLRNSTKNVARSAGRVQSPALSIIRDREDEIANFAKASYFVVKAKMMLNKKPVVINLTLGKRLMEEDCENIKKVLNGGATFKIEASVKEIQNSPPHYLDTASCLKECSKATKLPVAKVSKALQKLFEIGAITYIRTDSTTISHDAWCNIQEYVKAKYGPEYTQSSKRKKNKKTLHAQEAHEAIRPTNIHAEKVTGDTEVQSVYECIRLRTLEASMPAPLFSQQQVTLTGPLIDDVPLMAKLFKKVVIHNGSSVMGRKIANERHLVVENDTVKVTYDSCAVTTTKPPTLLGPVDVIEKMKSLGIGRPSTYASILETLEGRTYVELSKSGLKSTELGKTANEIIKTIFPDWVDYGFSSALEKDLDAIARGDLKKMDFLTDFKKKLNEPLSGEPYKKKFIGIHPKHHLNMYVSYSFRNATGRTACLGDLGLIRFAMCPKKASIEDVIASIDGASDNAMKDYLTQHPDHFA